MFSGAPTQTPYFCSHNERIEHGPGFAHMPPPTTLAHYYVYKGSVRGKPQKIATMSGVSKIHIQLVSKTKSLHINLTTASAPHYCRPKICCVGLLRVISGPKRRFQELVCFALNIPAWFNRKCVQAAIDFLKKFRVRCSLASYTSTHDKGVGRVCGGGNPHGFGVEIFVDGFLAVFTPDP